MSNLNKKVNKKAIKQVFAPLEGYQKVLEDQARLKQSGSDFTEQNYQVRNVINQLHPKRLSLKVSEVIEETESTKTLRLVSLNGELPPFLAGQYINLFVNIDGVETARPYAISSSPTDRGHYDLTVKRVLPGYVSHFLMDQVRVGDEFLSTGPMGTFYHNPLFHGEDVVFLAGGSGIAPAASMIESLNQNDKIKRFQLIYCSSFEHDVIFQENIDRWLAEQPKLEVTSLISRPTENYQGNKGRIDRSVLDKYIGTLEGKTFYVCGPTPFNEHCESLLKSLNVKSKRIRIEANGPPAMPEKLENWPEGLDKDQLINVSIVGQGSFQAKVGEPLLNSMERNGYSTENACRSGECSLCRVKVVKGSVFNPAEAKLRKSDHDYGWCHSCVAFPTEDVEILL